MTIKPVRDIPTGFFYIPADRDAPVITVERCSLKRKPYMTEKKKNSVDRATELSKIREKRLESRAQEYSGIY